MDYHHLSGWMFVNFITLILQYRIYSLPMKHDALKKHSPKDVFENMKRINMLHIVDEWKIYEIPKKTRTIIEELEIPTMQNKGS